MKFVFKTSFGEVKNRDAIIVKLTTDAGVVGYGECAALTEPIYLEETIKTCEHIINDILFPIVLGKTLTPQEFVDRTNYLRGNRIAKYGVECALWVIQSIEQNLSIKTLLGSEKTFVEIGESIGLLPTSQQTFELIEKRLAQGYKRIKLKICPGHDYQILKEVRDKFPDLLLMADANSAYTLDDIHLLKELDSLDLLMIEQPLGFDDITDHAILQKELKTPICLDESIISYDQARKAIEIGACKIINVKPARIGSLYESARINQLAKSKGIRLWCGGMLEAGIANVFNIYAASMSEFSLPADIFISKKLFDQDIVTPQIEMSAPGCIAVPDKVGLGYTVNEELMLQHLVE